MNNYSFTRSALLWAVLILFSSTAFCQSRTNRIRAAAEGPSAPDVNYTITNAIPASADAAALGKYGSIPVSPYTGVPNISVPLYAIKSGDLTLPVSLSYHAGGIRVEEMASSVGLGWSLNAGGAITRSVRGLPDEAINGFLDPTQYVPNILKRLAGDNTSAFTAVEANEDINAIAMGAIDGQPDIYNFNFGGYSGKFVMDAQGNVMTIPQQNIKFIFTQENNEITSFTAVTPDGVTWYFGSGDGTTAVETTSTSSNPHAPYAMSWFVSKILSPSYHEIDFTYVPDSYTQGQIPSQTLYTWIGGNNNTPRNDPPDQYLYSSNTFHTVRLSKITFENGTLTVAADSTRHDLNCKYINAISVANASGDYLKKYNLYYLNTSANRLRLDSVICHLDSINYSKEEYSFNYTQDSWRPLTSDFAYSQDWWGYDNGKGNVINNQGTIVPKVDNYNILGTATNLPGADRSPDADAMADGMLTRINYPTGGYTQFTYEANQESNAILQETQNDLQNPMLAFMSNDPQSIYFNNAHSMVLHIEGNPNLTIPVRLQAYGLGGTNLTSAILTDSTGTNLGSIGNTADSTINLTRGDYTITLRDPHNRTDTSVYDYDKYQLTAIWQGPVSAVDVDTSNYIAGGMRIKQIADYDGLSSTPYNLRLYKYTKPGQSGVSSGYLVFKPDYSYQMQVNRSVANGGGIGSFLYKNTYLARSAVSNYPLATTQGEVVGYAYVQELSGTAGQNGKTDYYYTTAQDYPDLPNDQGFPFAPVADQDWHRGLLIRETNFKAADGVYEKVTDKTCAYNSSISSFNKGIKAGFNPMPARYDQSLTYLNNVPENGDGELLATIYADATDFNYLSSETTRQYDSADTTGFVQNTTTYQYDPNTYLLRQVKTTDSKNENIIQTITYPYDYQTFFTPPGGSLAGVQNLTNMGIANYPIEEVTQKADTDGTNLRTIKAVLTTYKPGRAYRDSVYQLRTVTPLTDFTGSGTGVSTITKDSLYQAVVSFDKYDLYGNIIQEQKPGDALHTYIWGYTSKYSPHNHTLPVAEVMNADSADVAYTNFESYDSGGTGAGNWVYPDSIATDITAPMGSKYFDLSNGGITKNGLNELAVYTVSFWAKQGAEVTVTGGTVTAVATGQPKSGWVYRQYSISGTTGVTIGGTGGIDELRLYPARALMTTYTYIPLAGISGKCDAKSEITTYAFDLIGRLTQVKDANGSILKNYCYTYAGQPDGCPVSTASAAVYYNSDITLQLSRDNCGSGNSGSTVAYTVPAHRYASTVSQAAADSLALADLNANGQAYADSLGTCSLAYTNAADSATFTKTCGADSTGYAVTYIVPAGTYTSTVSQAVADSLAQDDVSRNGQNYADSTGSCTAIQYISFTVTNDTAEDYQVVFSPVTGAPLPFTVSQSSHGSIQVPTGTYTVDVYTNGSYNSSYTITLGSRTPQSAPRATFYNVNIATGSSDSYLLVY